ncbi:ATP-binding protein [Streptomyces subrutilus]|uniref:ATP-binding protein n=1 Tax=Streptomyces subrutilus TaxID=36818 RepID=UPI0033C7D7A3
MEQRRSPRRTWYLGLSGATDAVTRSRTFARWALIAWHWLPAAVDEDREAADDVLLLVSEVVANARLHGGGPAALLLHCTGDRLRIEVTDASPDPPVPVRPGPGPGAAGSGRPSGGHGHGLMIVERLARRWGFLRHPGGKCVWVEVAVPGPVRDAWPGGGRPAPGTGA